MNRGDKKCGNCWWAWALVDTDPKEALACTGLPPSVIHGGKFVRPHVKSTDPACSLWEPDDSVTREEPTGRRAVEVD